MQSLLGPPLPALSRTAPHLLAPWGTRAQKGGQLAFLTRPLAHRTRTLGRGSAAAQAALVSAPCSSGSLHGIHGGGWGVGVPWNCTTETLAAGPSNPCPLPWGTSTLVETSHHL